ncbi:MAG: hypothetical protein ACJ8AD_05995 [Gemmatimonadaceae bacterium]
MREFRDHRGREWRAWEVTPESMHPQTKAEDYLSECFQGGWVVFETTDGRDKRRLCPPPYAWEERDEADLERLVERAEVLRPLGAKRKRGSRPKDLPPSVPPDVAASMPRDPNGNLDMRYLGVVRSFLYPGGEVWRASVVAQAGGAPPVLRFSSESHAVDLTEWPPDWADLNDHELVKLLRSAESPHERRHREAPRRRHDDLRPDG